MNDLKELLIQFQHVYICGPFSYKHVARYMNCSKEKALAVISYGFDNNFIGNGRYGCYFKRGLIK
jgi:hypothetical protein